MATMANLIAVVVAVAVFSFKLCNSLDTAIYQQTEVTGMAKVVVELEAGLLYMFLG